MRLRRPLIAIFVLLTAVLVSTASASPMRARPKPVIHKTRRAESSVVSQPKPSKLAQLLAARNQNPDVVGWLTVPGTSLDLPVVHTADNKYYLKHDINHNPYWKGWPFMDFRNTVQPFSRNTVIYGHNMGDGTVFGELKKYKDINFLNANPVLYFGTEQQDYYWKIFSVYITDTNLNYIQTDFTGDNDYTGFLTRMKRQSLFNTSVDITASDDILTLSTCTYEFKPDARFVVQARLVRPGEDLSVVPATVNPNPLSPHH